MADLRDKPTRKRWPWAAVLLLLVMLYPLSLAPVVRLGVEKERVSFLYRPVQWAMYETSTAEALWWWARLWGVESELIYRKWELKFIRRLRRRGTSHGPWRTFTSREFQND